MTKVEKFKRYIISLNDRGGPIEEDYFELSFMLCQYARQGLTRGQILEVFEPLLVGTFIGKMLMVKKHGSFDILEQMYVQNYCSNVPWQNRWDDYIFSTWTCQAVRGRMDFLERFILDSPRELKSIVDIGCGSGRASRVVNTLQLNCFKDICYTGLDHDPEAIVYCEKMIIPIRIKYPTYLFVQDNILKTKIQYSADLVWSAGVFDYFNDDIFIRVLTKLITWAPENGYIVVGNLSPRCPNQCIMVLLRWFLFYRSKAHLLKLSEKLPIRKAWVDSDPMGIQHYLVLQK